MSGRDYSPLRENVEIGFFDATYSARADENYLPQLIVNDERQAKKVVDQLTKELKQAHYFWFSVAFMTTGGVAILKQELAELGRKGIQGKILVSQYQNFTQPQALREMLKLPNVELRMATAGNYHAKGYLFDRAENYTLIIGSSNLTQTALTRNQEWNLKVVTTKAAKLGQEALHEFETIFQSATVVTDDFIAAYEQQYRQTKSQWQQVTNPAPRVGTLQPNKMQTQALRSLNRLYDAGEKRALLVSATGTGKTYLSAFHVQAKRPKRFLFLVHRENIARAALASYQQVLGTTQSMGLYTGNEKTDADYVFATIQTLAKEEHLARFTPDYFDYIVIDETHRAGAKTYQQIMDYFQPQFLLGMTATPERSDDFNIFAQFDHNLAYEIRLQEALQQEMLAPFHYYGISELSLDGVIIDEKSEFQHLLAAERVAYVDEKIQFYGCDNGEVRGLIFCSRLEEAAFFAEQLNERGWRTLALSGATSEQQRQVAIERLELPHHDPEKLDYLLTVDIFNEGIDIPVVNQVVMLRPTQSAIIFVQQLGRGLRKTHEKSYLTVIDFIGNYANNFLVPIALFGDQSYNKDRLRQLMVQGTSMMPSTCSIHFEEIAKKQIFAAINQSKLQQRKQLVDDYRTLTYKLGRPPLMMDFVRFGARDPYQYVQAKKSYYHFVASLQSPAAEPLSSAAQSLLKGWQSEVLNDVRPTEAVFLQLLLRDQCVNQATLAAHLRDGFDWQLTDEEWESCLRNCRLQFVREKHEKQLIAYAQKYELDLLVETSRGVEMTHQLATILLTEPEFSVYVNDAIEYAQVAYAKRQQQGKCQQGFSLNQKYTRKDVFRVLNWQENPVAQNVGGYMISPDKKTCPLFVTYHKAATMSETTQYEDRFVSEQQLEWYSKSGRTLQSQDVQTINQAAQSGLRLPLFVKKSDDEGLAFYYLGELEPLSAQTRQMQLAGKSVVQFQMRLAEPINEKLYEYLTMETTAE